MYKKDPNKFLFVGGVLNGKIMSVQPGQHHYYVSCLPKPNMRAMLVGPDVNPLSLVVPNYRSYYYNKLSYQIDLWEYDIEHKEYVGHRDRYYVFVTNNADGKKPDVEKTLDRFLRTKSKNLQPDTVTYLGLAVDWARV